MNVGEPAIRVDPATGARETLSFFGDHAPYLYGATCIPAGDPTAAVIVCGSIHAELIKAYRKEVLIGRALAARGIGVQRFHYRGAGHSEGDDRMLNLDDMIDAVAEARNQLLRYMDVDRIGYLGTRLGAFPAAVAAAEQRAPLVLWSPIQDADAFMNEVFRSHYIAAMKGERKPESTTKMIERLQRTGEIELVGYRFTSAFYNSLSGRRLVDIAPKGCRVMLVPFGPEDFTELTEAWTAAGADVGSHPAFSRDSWWLATDPTEAEDGQVRTTTLVDGIVDWFATTLAE